MRKLISLFVAMLMSLHVYSNEPEYVSVGKQFNAVVVNVPASFIITRGEEHSVKITNESHEFYSYEMVNDTLVIKSKYTLDVNSMEAKKLKVELTHPSPSKLYHGIQPQGRGLSKSNPKSGNQK